MEQMTYTTRGKNSKCQNEYSKWSILTTIGNDKREGKPMNNPETKTKKNDKTQITVNKFTKCNGKNKRIIVHFYVQVPTTARKP